MRTRVKATIVAALGVAWLAAACGNDDTAPTPTPAAPTKTETFAGTLPVGGSRFFSFTVSKFGTTNVTLASLSGADATVTVGLALGFPSGTGCSTGTGVAAAAGTTPQLTDDLNAGVYCTRIYDLGTLAGSAEFVVTIAYP